MLGQSSYSLTCVVMATGTVYPSITYSYQWTKDNGNQTIQVGTDRVLSFSPLRLSDAGQYTCQATVNPCNLTKMDIQNVTLQSELLCSDKHCTVANNIIITIVQSQLHLLFC